MSFEKEWFYIGVSNKLMCGALPSQTIVSVAVCTVGILFQPVGHCEKGTVDGKLTNKML